MHIITHHLIKLKPNSDSFRQNVVGFAFPSIKIARGYKPISQWLNLSRLVFIANLICGWRFTLVYLYYLKCVLKHVNNDLPVRLKTTLRTQEMRF